MGLTGCVHNADPRTAAGTTLLRSWTSVSPREHQPLRRSVSLRPRELDYQLNERSEVGNLASPAVSTSADVKVPFATVPDRSAVHCQWVGLVQC